MSAVAVFVLILTVSLALVYLGGSLIYIAVKLIKSKDIKNGIKVCLNGLTVTGLGLYLSPFRMFI